MQTDDAKQNLPGTRGTLRAYVQHAHLKCHHGAAQVLVRGIAKVTCVALLAALTSNLLAHAAALLASTRSSDLGLTGATTKGSPPSKV